MNLGNAYHSLGDFKTAIEFHQQALSIFKEAGNKDSEGSVYGSLGIGYHSLGDFKAAIKSYHQALKIAKEVGNKITEGNSYTNLGNVYFLDRDYEEATEHYQQSLNIAKEVGNKTAEGLSYLNLGVVYSSLGNFKKAIEFHRKSLNIAKEVGSKDSEGRAYENLGTVCSLRRDFKTAIEYHRKALSIAKEIGDKMLAAKTYSYLGTDHHFLGDVCKAEDFYKCSVRLFDELRGLLQSNDKWKIDFRNQYKDSYSRFWLFQLQQNKTVEALLPAERGRAQALMDLMESQYGVKSVHPVSTEQTNTIYSISSHLPSQTIFLAEETSSLNFWVMQKGHRCQFEQKAISDSLESLCENRSLDSPADEESEEVPDRNRDEKERTSAKVEGDALKALSDVVHGTISHLIHSNDVIIVPDGPLFLITYAALLNQHSRYLSEKLTIRLVPTLTYLKLMTECPEEYHSTSGALLVGDPWVEGVRFR